MGSTARGGQRLFEAGVEILEEALRLIGIVRRHGGRDARLGRDCGPGSSARLRARLESRARLRVGGGDRDRRGFDGRSGGRHGRHLQGRLRDWGHVDSAAPPPRSARRRAGSPPPRSRGAPFSRPHRAARASLRAPPPLPWRGLWAWPGEAGAIPTTVRRPTSLARDGRSPDAPDVSAVTEGIASVAFPIGGGGAWDGLTGTPGRAPTSVWARAALPASLPFAASFRPPAVAMGAPHSPQKTTGASHSVPHDGHLALGPLTRRASPAVPPGTARGCHDNANRDADQGRRALAGRQRPAPAAAMGQVIRRPRRRPRPPRRPRPADRSHHAARRGSRGCSPASRRRGASSAPATSRSPRPARSRCP